MSESYRGGCSPGTIPGQGRIAIARGIARWLGLAAAPTFAIMALLTAVAGGGQPAMLCSAMPDGSPLGSMATMYALMSAFHATPWLRLVFGERTGVG